MNVPNLNFDADGGSGRLPATSAYGPRSVANAPNNESAVFNFQDEPRSDLRKNFFQYLGLALKYRWLIVVCCTLSLVIGFISTYTQTPIYQATVTIQIDQTAARVVKVDTPEEPNSGVDTLRFYQTQYDLLRSRSLAERVVTDLDLAAASDFLNPPSTSAWGKLRSLIRPSASTSTGNDNSSAHGNIAQRKDAGTNMVLSGLSIAPVPNSTLVRISFDSPSPAWAQRVANGVADSYVNSNLERRYGATAYARNFLKERLDELKLKLEDSEKALVAYAQEKELIGDIKPSGNKDAANQSLAESDLAAFNTVMETVVADRIHAQEVWEQANNSKEIGLPQILEDSAIKTLRGQRAVLWADYQNKLSSFKPDYPDMLRLKAQINEIDQEIKSEADVIKQSLKAHYDSALQQEVLLRNKMDEVKRGVLETRNKEIQYNILKREADTNRSLYDGLLQQYKDIGVAGAVGTNNVAVIDRAQLPGAPYKPDLRMNLVRWLAFGLFGAGLVIALFEIFDDTFKSPEEIEEQLGLAVLGLIPMSDESVLDEINGSSNGAIAEAFRSFRTALQFSTDRGTPESIVVTSAQPGEGKSTTAFALAVNFAQLGMKVLLIDADLRNPSQHRNLSRSNGAGLSNYLAGAVTAEGIFQKTDVDGLYFMPSGPLPPNPAELLAGPKMLSLLSTAGEKLDVVIIDSPPVLGLADAPLLASIASGTLLVLATGHTRRGVVKRALKRLHFARARMVGALMNKCDFRSNYGYGGYGYGYGSNHAALEYYGYGQKDQLAQVEHSPPS